MGSAAKHYRAHLSTMRALTAILMLVAVVGPAWASAVASTPDVSPALPNMPMLTGTDGYGMQFAMRRGPGCRLEMAFDGPQLVAHLQMLKDEQLVSAALTPAMADREVDMLAFVLAQRAGAAALPHLAMVPGATSCEVVASVNHTPLSRQGPHTLVSFTIDSVQARTFADHVPRLTELRAKSTKFFVSTDDIRAMALESDQAQLTHAN